ncbi:MAG: hypothetical protein KJ017_01400 [Alphaproteobacteria bacterium]|nr:hypothetical protein [Alphaproteobacteria bacterium]
MKAERFSHKFIANTEASMYYAATRRIKYSLPAIFFSKDFTGTDRSEDSQDTKKCQKYSEKTAKSR